MGEGRGGLVMIAADRSGIEIPAKGCGHEARLRGLNLPNCREDNLRECIGLIERRE